MKKYSNYQKDPSKNLTECELKNVDWTKYKIVVPNTQDKQELIEAFKVFHDSGYDSDYIACNQIAHEYLGGDNIIVSKEMYEILNTKF